MTRSASAVVLVAHGTVESLDELPEFLTNIRRGHAPPPELLAEVRRRYEAIGGRSPLLDVTREVAKKLAAEIGVPVRVAMRLYRPYAEDVLAELSREGIRHIVVLPLAPHSAGVYGDAVREAAKKAGLDLTIDAAPNWGQEPMLTAAFESAVFEALDKVPTDARARTALVTSAHSLPLSVIEAGDPYEQEFRASADAVARAILARRPGAFAEHLVTFQSQGMSAGPRGAKISWLGPALRATLELCRDKGLDHVVLAPIGFLADHVEILYDLDIEAKAWGEELGIVTYRSPSLNARDELVAALALIARRELASKA